MSKKINSVSFDQGGFKGLKVSYSQSEISGGFAYPNEYTKKSLAPIHAELKAKVETFIERTIKACHLNRDKQFESEITAINRKGSNFVISIKCKSDSAKGWYSVSTPLLTPGDYGGFDNLEKEWYALLEEVDNYISGTASANTRQMVMDFAFTQVQRAKSQEDLEEYESFSEDVKTMTDEEIVEQARVIVEGRGGILYTPEDLAPQGEPILAETASRGKGKNKQASLENEETF